MCHCEYCACICIYAIENMKNTENTGQESKEGHRACVRTPGMWRNMENVEGHGEHGRTCSTLRDTLEQMNDQTEKLGTRRTWMNSEKLWNMEEHVEQEGKWRTGRNFLSVGPDLMALLQFYSSVLWIRLTVQISLNP